MSTMQTRSGTQLPLTTGISLEQFLTEPSVPEHSEWVRRAVIEMPPIGAGHADRSAFLGRILGIYLEERALGRLFMGPFQIWLPATQTRRAPDLMVVLNEHLERVRPTRLEGPADLAIVISPESRARDRGEKYYEYEQAGVPEYWLIDPDRRVAEFHRGQVDLNGRAGTVDPGRVALGPLAGARRPARLGVDPVRTWRLSRKADP